MGTRPRWHSHCTSAMRRNARVLPRCEHGPCLVCSRSIVRLHACIVTRKIRTWCHGQALRLGSVRPVSVPTNSCPRRRLAPSCSYAYALIAVGDTATRCRCILTTAHNAKRLQRSHACPHPVRIVGENGRHHSMRYRSIATKCTSHSRELKRFHRSELGHGALSCPLSRTLAR